MFTIPIGIVVDEDREFSMKIYEQLNVLKDTFPRVKERVNAVSFVNDYYYPGVQVADMIAYEARKLMVEKIANPNAEPSELFRDLTVYGTHSPRLYTPAILDHLQATKGNNILDAQVLLFLLLVAVTGLWWLGFGQSCKQGLQFLSSHFTRRQIFPAWITSAGLHFPARTILFADQEEALVGLPEVPQRETTANMVAKAITVIKSPTGLKPETGRKENRCARRNKLSAT